MQYIRNLIIMFADLEFIQFTQKVMISMWQIEKIRCKIKGNMT